MIRIISFFGVFLLSMPIVASAQDVRKYSEDYVRCVSKNVGDPMSTECVDSEINTQDKLIDSFIGKHDDITSPEDGNVVDLKLFTDGQRKGIDEKCDLWLKSGGQNGVLLSKQCILDETISLKILLSNFVSSVDG